MATTSTANTRKSLTILLIGIIGVAGTLAALAIGFSEFTTTSTTGSILGDVVESDESFDITASGISVATNAMRGTAAGTTPQEITTGNPVFRTNDVTRGNFVYRVVLTEASALTSGTWEVKILQDGNQIGDTVTLTQATPATGTEGATVIADLGTSLPNENVFEVRITKTG